MLLFEASVGYQPPLIKIQKWEIADPLVQECLHGAREAWKKTQEASNQRSATHHHIPAPSYQPGQLVWLSKLDVLLDVAGSFNWSVSHRESGEALWGMPSVIPFLTTLSCFAA